MVQEDSYLLTSQGLYTVLNQINGVENHVNLFLSFVYTIICIFWLFYAIINIYTQLRIKRRLEAIMQSELNYDYRNDIFIRKESIMRNVLFILLLFFELAYCLNIDLAGVVVVFLNYTDVNISIGSNCSVDSSSLIGMSYDSRVSSIFIKGLSLFDDYCFSMMIWIFGVSLLHLSFAAKNELRVKTIIHLNLFGIIIYLLIALFASIPYTSLFGPILHSVVDQISIFVALYIARKKFFPAMNSRVIDAYHLHNANVYLQQKRLFKQYKVLVFVFIFTFELMIFKNVFLYNIVVIFEAITVNSCWFHVTFHIPLFTVLASTQNIFQHLSPFILVISHLIDFIVYSNFLIVNVNFIYVVLKRHLVRKRKYRYQIFSAPLLSDYN